MNKKKTGLIMSILGVLSLVLITTGITYAFFNYAKEGTTENSITTGTITFLYEEAEKNGAGISIENAYPVSDDAGKNQSDAKEVFNFTITSDTTMDTEIPYTITARKKAGSTLDEDVVKLYLTEVNGTNETPLTESIYESLTNYTNAPQGVSEKVLYTSTVPAESNNYVKNYRLRMWIPSTINFSQLEDGTYPYNGKTFTVTVNVYANATVVTLPTESVAYYSFGTPTTESTTDYTTLGRNVFATLGTDGSTGVCINDGGLFCLKTNDYDNSVASLKTHFGEDRCTDNESSFDCYSETFRCGISSDGFVSCRDLRTDAYCNARVTGIFSCNEQ